MKTPNFKVPSVSLPSFINKTVLPASAAVLFVVIVAAFGAVRSVQTDNVAKAQHALEVERQKDRDAKLTELEKANTQLKAQVQFSEAKNESICSWVRSITPKYRIATPPLCVKV